MKAIFAGTPLAAVPALIALSRTAEVQLVVTRPDRPRGRSRRPQPSAVKQAALDLGLTVSQPETAAQLSETVGRVNDLDVAVVVAYGALVRPEVLAMPRSGFINVHFSILPRWRGAAPVQRAILAGDRRTGVTLMGMDEGLDTGPILATASTAIGTDEDASDLTGRLSEMGARLLETWLDPIVDGRVAPVTQDSSRATTAPKLTTHERWIDIAAPANEVLTAVRGLAPWPGAWAHHDTGALRIHRAVPGNLEIEPGVLAHGTGGLELGVGDGSILLVEVQPEGRRRMPGIDWARGLTSGLGHLS